MSFTHYLIPIVQGLLLIFSLFERQTVRNSLTSFSFSVFTLLSVSFTLLVF